MPESAEEVYARVVAQVGPDGHLPMPPVDEWDVFPWAVREGRMVPRVVEPPLEREKPRQGEDEAKCWRCHNSDAGAIWGNDRWVVTAPERPGGLPLVLTLHSREHMDFLDLDDEYAAEYGTVTSWLHRIMAYLPNIGRVHVCKWGDDSVHLHTWFIARTARLPHIYGSSAVDWNEILPPVPEDVWRADVATVARKLANHDGEVLL